MPESLPLHWLRSSRALPWILEIVRDAEGEVVTFTGTAGGRDLRTADHIRRRLEPVGVQATFEKWVDDVTVVLKLSDGALPNWEPGKSEPRPFSRAEQAATGVSYADTNATLLH